MVFAFSAEPNEDESVYVEADSVVLTMLPSEATTCSILLMLLCCGLEQSRGMAMLPSTHLFLPAA